MYHCIKFIGSAEKELCIHETTFRSVMLSFLVFQVSWAVDFCSPVATARGNTRFDAVAPREKSTLQQGTNVNLLVATVTVITVAVFA